MTAPPTFKISDTFTPWITLARLFAFFHACEFSRGTFQVNLTFACVAYNFFAQMNPRGTRRRVWCTSRAWSCGQSHGNRLIRQFSLRALSAEVTAPPAFEKRDALALRVILAWLLACRDVGDFARWLAPVDLASAHVALQIRADVHPRALHSCGSMNCLQERGSVNKVYTIGY